MVAPVVVGTPTTFASAVSGATITLTKPTGVQDGDMLVAVLRTSGSSSPTDFVLAGWSREGLPFVPNDAAGRVTGIYLHAVTNAASEPASYAFVKSVADPRLAGAMFIVRGVDLASPIAGESVGYDASPAPRVQLNSFSVDTTDAALLVYAWGTEVIVPNASAPTIVPGTQIALVPSSDGTGATRTVLWAGSEVSSTAPTGHRSLTWVSAAGASATGIVLRGLAAPQPPATGQIGAHLSTSPAHNSLTIGIDRLGGTAVVAVLRDQGVEIARQPVSVDNASGWGNIVFPGLADDTEYDVRFEVDGVEQTDAQIITRTLPATGPRSFTMVTGSCQFTASNHPVWDAILAENPVMLAHMGDLHYADATTLAAWRTGVEASLTAARMRTLLEHVPMTWTWDNHDRVIVDDGGAGNGLNFGRTDPTTNTEWRRLAGTTGWASPDAGGRTWVIGRARFIQTDNWTAKDDPDAGGPAPLTFLGAAQKQWFKDTLEAATEPLIVWLAQWTTATTGSGRWDSYPEETAELEAFLDARPALKSRVVMIGGDSHSLQVTDGSRTLGNFVGVPSYNISGFNRSSDTGHGGGGWLYDEPLRTAAQSEADWGGYSRVTVTDDGSTLTFLWEGVRVGPTGATDVMAAQTITVSSEASAGVVAQTLPALTSQASGMVTAPAFAGTVAAAFPPLVQAAVAEGVAPVFSGIVTATAPALVQAAVGQSLSASYTGTTTMTLPALTTAVVGITTIPEEPIPAPHGYGSRSWPSRAPGSERPYSVR